MKQFNRMKDLTEDLKLTDEASIFQRHIDKVIEIKVNEQGYVYFYYRGKLIFVKTLIKALQGDEHSISMINRCMREQ